MNDLNQIPSNGTNIKIGVIADDFTGATDAASFIVKSGLSAVQFSGTPSTQTPVDAGALVISLKSRSCPVEQAIEQSLHACDWLLQQGCGLIYFKYCSTFDSTSEGNIGPVTEALMKRLQVKSTLICPALPINGRTVYQGHLFVFDQLLSDSGMKNHPITPMTESNLLKLMEMQASGKTGLLDMTTISIGSEAVDKELESMSTLGCQFIICDSICDADLLTLANSARRHRLVTGGSGLVGAIAEVINTKSDTQSTLHPSSNDLAASTQGVVLSGSCSVMTNKQVAAYQPIAPSFKLSVYRSIHDPKYVEEVESWVSQNSIGEYFPLVYATVEAQELKAIQNQYGSKASYAVEQVFNSLVKRLFARGFNTFISAGGETSGTVTQALSVSSFKVGQTIAPGVPWMTSLDDELRLALKSGNFGNEHFFAHAQEQLR